MCLLLEAILIAVYAELAGMQLVAIVVAMAKTTGASVNARTYSA